VYKNKARCYCGGKYRHMKTRKFAKAAVNARVHAHKVNAVHACTWQFN